MLKHVLAGSALLAACLPAAAQSPRTLMPEGSSDMTLALAAVIGPSAIGSDQQRLGVVPLLSVQWANGVFINMNTLGMHLSERDDLAYGPLFSPKRSRLPGEDGKERRSRFTPEAGGFVEYRVSGGLRLSSRLMYGGSSDRRGVLARSGASAWTTGPAHHGFGVEAQLTLANRASLQDDFGVAHGGLRDASVSLHWSWEMTHKTTLRAWVEEQRFLGGVRSSPRLVRGGGTTLVALIARRF